MIEDIGSGEPKEVSVTKLKVLSAAVAAAVGAMLVFSLVPASSQQPPARTQFELVEFANKAREIFLNTNKRNDFGPGDMLILSNAMFDSADTSDRVGKFSVQLAFQPPRRCGCFTFTGAVKLADGKLSVSGLGEDRDFETGFEAPIVGGTGNFSGAHGTVTITDQQIDGKNGSRWAFDFVVPAN
jgi:hypothetical protein